MSPHPLFFVAYSSSSPTAAVSAPEPGSAGAAPGIIKPDPIIAREEAKPKFHWKPALWQSARFLGVMHAFRFATEPSTRKRVNGPFWENYFDSVLGSDGWGDSDPFMVNYLGHPLEGSVAGYIFIQNDDRGRNAEFGNSGDYWKSRLRAMAWSAAFSVQFELGPVSEASLGNVGKDLGPKGENYMGAVDLVVTPLMGFGWMIAEDALDKHTIRGIERRTDSRVLRAMARGFLNPTRSFANMMRWQAPWYRDTRPLQGGVTLTESAPAPGSASGARGH